MENYQLMLDEILKRTTGTPTLMLHACCAPCSSYVLEYLSGYFSITIYYYNPNTYPSEEYERRFAELEKFLAAYPLKNPVMLIKCEYKPEEFYEMAKGMESIPEGGERCFECYKLRMKKAAEAAADKGFDYFGTVLSISPHKNAQKINEIGFELQERYNVKFLPADFKKRNGFKRSTELSREYGLYRQNYCGCAFSKREAISRALQDLQSGAACSP